MERKEIVLAQGDFLQALSTVDPKQILTIEDIAFSRLELCIARDNRLRYQCCYPANFVGYTVQEHDGKPEAYLIVGGRKAFLELVVPHAKEFYHALKSGEDYVLNTSQVKWIEQESHNRNGDIKVYPYSILGSDGQKGDLGLDFARGQKRDDLGNQLWKRDQVGTQLYGRMFGSMGLPPYQYLHLRLLLKGHVLKNAKSRIISRAVTFNGLDGYVSAPNINATETEHLSEKDHAVFVAYASK